jgi:hypothetical protein
MDNDGGKREVAGGEHGLETKAVATFACSRRCDDEIRLQYKEMTQTFLCFYFHLNFCVLGSFFVCFLLFLVCSSAVK